MITHQQKKSRNLLVIPRMTPANDGIRRPMPPAGNVMRPAKGGGYRRQTKFRSDAND